MELRCPNTLQALLEEGVVEVKCRHFKCGARSGVVVLHRFNIETGELIETKRYKDPSKEVKHGTRNQRTALRSA